MSYVGEESPTPYFGRPAPVRSAVSRGQGKVATTILADQGDIVTVITDVPYKIRSRHDIPHVKRGTRPMHTSTLTIPTSAKTNYSTTSKCEFGGTNSKPIPEKRVPYPPQFSQITFDHDMNGEYPPPWGTNYDGEFMYKGSKPPAVLHLPSFENRMAMQAGGEARKAMVAGGTHAAPTETSYWTQYNRVHNKLGAMRGPGIAREYPIRQSYNPITGEEKGGAWQAENKRISGNRILYQGYRKDADKEFVF